MESLYDLYGKCFFEKIILHSLLLTESGARQLEAIKERGTICLKKEELLNGFNKLLKDYDKLILWEFSLSSALYSLILRIIPSELNEKDKEIGERLRKLASGLRSNMDVQINCIDLYEKAKDIETFKSGMATIGSSSFLGFLLLLETYEYFYGNKDNKEKETIKILLDLLGSQLTTIMQSTEQIVKNSEQTLRNTQESINLENRIITNQTINRDKNSRDFEKIEKKVSKRNIAEKRKPLTQEECADTLFKQKQVFYQKRENYLRRVGITSTVLQLPNPKSVERTIQRWDQYLATDGEKGTKPPKGYSREHSLLEFDRWAEVLESLAYEKWEKKQPRIRRKPQKPDSPEDEENIEEENEDQTIRAQGNLVARFDHSRKR